MIRCLAILWVVLVGRCDAQSSADPLLRTRIEGDRICSLTGRWLTVNRPDGQLTRAWVGIREYRIGPQEAWLVQRRNAARLVSAIISQDSLRDVAENLRAEERGARIRHCRTIQPKWFDVAVVQIQTPAASRFYCAADMDIDGSLDDESWCEVDRHTAARAVEKDPLRFCLRRGALQPGTFRGSFDPCRTDNPDNRRSTSFTGEPAGSTSSVVNEAGAGSAPLPAELRLLVSALHRLDQAATRKQSLAAVIASADDVINFVDRPMSASPREWESVLADALYRKGRALGYQELPDVAAVTPVADPEQLQRDFESNFARLDGLVDTTQPAYILLRIRRERRRNRRGVALDLVDVYRRTHAHPVWYLKKRYDLLTELGAAWQAHQAAASLWLHAEKPIRPVPVLFRTNDDSERSKTSEPCTGSWITSTPFRDRQFRFRSVPSGAEAIVWLEPGKTVVVDGLTSIDGRSSYSISASGNVFDVTVD